MGLSKDSLESHRRFAEKYDLRIYLLADPNGEILARLGIRGLGGIAKRTTFIVDKSGIVRYVFEDVSVRGHADDVLALVQSLN